MPIRLLGFNERISKVITTKRKLSETWFRAIAEEADTGTPDNVCVMFLFLNLNIYADTYMYTYTLNI